MNDDNHPARFSLVHQIGELNKTIEALRAECNHLYKKLNDTNDTLQEIAISEENYKAENARLEELKEAAVVATNKAMEERVRLRKELRKEQEALLTVVDQREALRAENARLREALNKAAIFLAIASSQTGSEPLAKAAKSAARAAMGESDE